LVNSYIKIISSPRNCSLWCTQSILLSITPCHWKLIHIWRNMHIFVSCTQSAASLQGCLLTSENCRILVGLSFSTKVELTTKEESLYLSFSLSPKFMYICCCFSHAWPNNVICKLNMKWVQMENDCSKNSWYLCTKYSIASSQTSQLGTPK